MKSGPRLGRPGAARKWYRASRHYAYWRGVQQAADADLWSRLTRGPVILMYHAFGPAGSTASRYVIPIERFARQMAWLKRHNYQVISLNELADCRRNHRLPPARSVVITIDDGYADTRDLAHPVLEQYGFPATVFVVSDLVGRTNEWDASGDLAGRPILSRDAIEALAADGMSIGAHSCSHPRLSSLDPEPAMREIAGSRRALEEAIGTPVRTFAYPFGRHIGVEELVEQAGFDVACSVIPGMNSPATPAMLLRRLMVPGTDTLFDFALALEYGDDPRHVLRFWRHRHEK